MAQGTIQAGNPLEAVHTRTTTTGPQSMACVVGVDGSDTVVGTAAGLRVDLSSNGRQTSAHVVTGPNPLTAPVPVNSFSLPMKSVFITAWPTNTQRIVVGDSNISPADATLRGIPLEPGQGIQVDLDDLNNLYFHTVTGDTGLTWTAVM